MLFVVWCFVFGFEVFRCFFFVFVVRFVFAVYCVFVVLNFLCTVVVSDVLLRVPKNGSGFRCTGKSDLTFILRLVILLLALLPFKL